MKRSGTRRRSSSSKRKETSTGQMKGTLARHLQVQLEHQYHHQPPPPPLSTASSSLFQKLLESEPSVCPASEHEVGEAAAAADDRDFILSQDFFCTPDYITPDNQNIFIGFDCNKDNIPCPKSPEKISTVKNKRFRQDCALLNPLSPTLSDHIEAMELAKYAFDEDEDKTENEAGNVLQKPKNYVSESAVALRCRVMPPPCVKNPYLSESTDMNIDPFRSQRSKCADLLPAFIGGDGLSRYRADFHEIEQIGAGHFSHVFKVLKRLDGCFYAVKHTTKLLHQDGERRKALMEVQALAALGFHENIVGYYSSWFEEEHLYIQMELCDYSLSRNKCSSSFTEAEVLNALHQIAKALQFIHEKGIAHLDVKPDNIYVRNGTYKLGDFGCATLVNKSLLIEEGDARYMPHEILNENYDHLDKVDIFSLGAAIYELIRGSPLPDSGLQLFNLREGKLPLLPGYSLQFQNLLKAMVDHDAVRRPSAKEIVENPIFNNKMKRNAWG